MQSRIQAGKLSYDKSNDIYKIIDKEFCKIDKKHTVDELVCGLEKECNFVLRRDDVDAIKKINEFFNRRYYKNEGTVISLLLVQSIDRIFFDLRAKIDKKVPVSLIDEIFFNKKFAQVTLPIHAFAYVDNQSFKSRPHPPYCRRVNGKDITWSGSC